jgi:DNA-directed RNA polymerase subunit RPC12/RpoP
MKDQAVARANDILDHIAEELDQIRGIMNEDAGGGDGGDAPYSKNGDTTSSNSDAISKDGDATTRCVVCGYTWEPRKPLSEIRKCPRCNSRNWNEDREKVEPQQHLEDDAGNDDDSVNRLRRFLEEA